MEITPIGFLCVLVAMLVVARPVEWGLLAICAFLPLTTAAAVNLPAAGGQSLICAHVLIGALAAGVALRPRLARGVLRSLASRPAAACLALFALYGAASAFLMPRVFEGAVQVYSFERPPEGFGIPLVGLRPTGGNITQPLYMAVNLAFFGIAVMALAGATGVRRAAAGLNVATAVHLLFAALSAIPSNAVSATVLEFVRTANYDIMAETTMAGVRRIIGSYAEASSFGSTSMSLFAWNLIRFLQTRGVLYFAASLATFACMVASFSTTAYFVMLVLAMIWSLHTAYKLVRAGLGPDQLTGLLMSSVVLMTIALLLFYEPARVLAAELYERMFGEKLQSASGVERSAWNLQGLQNFAATYGLGVGLGSARTSSLVTALLGNTGAIGTALFAGFLVFSFLRPWPGRRTPEATLARRIFVAARAGGLSLLIAHIIAGGAVDAGLTFMLFAAVATGAAVSPLRGKSAADSGLFPQPTGRLWVASPTGAGAAKALAFARPGDAGTR